MASLTGLFKNAPEETKDSEKLLDLYRNRAELKKEFDALRNEKYQLQDRVRHHEGATARVQQKLDHVENLLLDREWVHNVVVFYQLRRLGTHCHGKLERFAEQLKQQREKRVHSKTLQSWNDERASDAALIEGNIGKLRLQVQLLEDQLQSERHRYLTMGRIAKLLRGSRLESRIRGLEAKIESGQSEEHELLSVLDSNHNRVPPTHEGLSVAEKRSINFMILSFAQHLYLHFAADGLASLAKEASEKSVGGVNYGSKSDCDSLLKLVDQHRESMEQVTDIVDILQKRAAKIAAHAMFGSDQDAVPVPGSVATVYQIGADGGIQERDGNLLGQNYFAIATVMSR